jgi:tetratricopeptide (TPR) repeat protein
MFHPSHAARVLATVLAVMVGGVVLAAEEPPSLEHLLRQLEQAELAARPAMNAESAESLRKNIDDVLRKRNEVVRRDGGFFGFLEDARKTYVEYGPAFQNCMQAAVAVRIAAHDVAVQRNLGQQAGKQTALLAPAEGRLRSAEGTKREADRVFERVAARIHAHDTRMHRDAPEFFRAYFILRGLLPHRRDPANAVIAETLTHYTNTDHDFSEGRVVSAIALVYVGDGDKAAAHLDAVEAACKRYPLLFQTTIAEDCCATWLLLGRPDKVTSYITKLRSLPEKGRTFSQEWLLAAYDSLRGQREKALKTYAHAIRKTNAGEYPALHAEAAMAALTGTITPNKIQTARQFLEGIQDDSQWSVLRARASLEAAEERWEEAVVLLDQAASLMPPCVASVVAEQRDAYKNGKPWITTGSR